MTDELRNTALYMHNYYRGLLASGWAKDGKIGYAKPAAAMIQLKYDCDVENKIMEKFKDCQTPTLTQPFNFKQYSKFEESRESALKAVIDEWWSALAKTGVPDNKYVEADMKDKPLGDYVNTSPVHVQLRQDSIFLDRDKAHLDPYEDPIVADTVIGSQ
ncbi:hypothetical protein ANCDUO_02416 [Ancylostoma duodenale]|uniref:SCP domain-containing protein n=1 Tax=Ancylostoma duodenale TaxID=51022 RepID=A0A0C2H0G5_9BILA|nr:hypothetical protein ANCDUO_02416 [Ancylostoma duodenale]